MSRKTLIIVVVVGLLLLCICGVGGAAYFGFMTAGKAIEQAVVTDPAEVAAVGKKIADYQMPPGYSEQFGMSLLGMDIVAMAPTEGGNDELIMFMQFPASMNLDQAEMEKQLRQNMQGHGTENPVETKAVGQTTATIRDAKVTLTVSEGTGDNGVTIRQLTGVFSGKGGPTLLMIQGRTDTWDQAKMDAFMASIH